MTIGTTRRVLSLALLVGALAGAAPVAAQDLAEVQAQVAEARRRFDALDYEQAVPALDRVVAVLSSRRTDDTRRLLADAYEMRARARFGLGDQAGAREDFISLLKVDPARTLTGQISPRVVAIFDDARKNTVTQAKLTIVPANAEVTLDGVTIPSNATIPVIVGDHTLAARRIGYRSGTVTFNAAPNAITDAALTLARESAVLAVVTTPAEVDVLVDGVVRGKTVAGPPPGDYAERAARAGVPLAQLSAVLTLADIPAGAHRIEFRRGCFVAAERRMDVTRLEDVVLDPVKLAPAVATVNARASQPGARVFIDGQEKGAAPVTAELCEGDHTVELRGTAGRYSRRVDARAGQRVDVNGELKPSFALVSAGAQGALGADLRVVVERALEPVRSVTVFAPPCPTSSNSRSTGPIASPTRWPCSTGQSASPVRRSASRRSTSSTRRARLS